MPKSAVDLCELIGFDAVESGLYYKGRIDERISKRRVACSCLSERNSSVFLLPKHPWTVGPDGVRGVRRERGESLGCGVKVRCCGRGWGFCKWWR